MHEQQRGAAAHQERNVSGDRNPSWRGGATIKAVSASGKTYARQQPYLEIEKGVRRKRAKDRATPKWADLEKVREIYRLCRELSEKTGVQYHVDHVVPLNSNLVCGLHTENNLEVLPGVENLRKHNRHWPDMW